ncbi:hypothetical protein CPC_0248 [Clostridium perfringens C str. JGS1495]|nr:hypothetical protein CPC_0248 [Clostridium perfringens C str. JGS1495]
MGETLIGRDILKVVFFKRSLKIINKYVKIDNLHFTMKKL